MHPTPLNSDEQLTYMHLAVLTEAVAVLSAVNGMGGPEAGAMHISEVYAAAPSAGIQHAAVCACRGSALPNLGSVHPICQAGCAAHGKYSAERAPLYLC